MRRTKPARARNSAIPQRDAFLWESARQKAEAMRDAMAAADTAFKAYQQVSRADVLEKEEARQAWEQATKARDDAQHSAAFQLGYLMLGQNWYAQLRGYASQDAYITAVLADVSAPAAAAEGLSA